MSRIFLTLSTVANSALVVTLFLRWWITDPASLTVRWHMLTAVAAALLVLLVHAVTLTYFMGTGRWLEETCAAYNLGNEPRAENIRLKYRVIPGMMACIVLVVLTGAFGAMADTAANASRPSAAGIHLGFALTTLLANLLVSWIEQRAIVQNGVVVDNVVGRVAEIRRERGLDQPADVDAGSSASRDY